MERAEEEKRSAHSACWTLPNKSVYSARERHKEKKKAETVLFSAEFNINLLK